MEVLNAKPGGTCGNQSAFKGLMKCKVQQAMT